MFQKREDLPDVHGKQAERHVDRGEDLLVVQSLVLVHQAVAQLRRRRKRPGEFVVYRSQPGGAPERLEVVVRNLSRFDGEVRVDVGRYLDDKLQKSFNRAAPREVRSALL